MSITRLHPAFTLTQDRLAELEAVVPEAFADGAINWEALKEALGGYLEDDSATAEHFGLFWPGKREARHLTAMPSKGSLHPARGEGIDEDTTRNLFIEGDNLEVLKLLLKSYAGRVKMIYIDPPYNTGNDFVYKDDYSEPLQGYLRRTGQTSEQGTTLTTNARTVGRFHSNWLNMIYPRLILARSFLSDDGIIFVSIDDNEVNHLELLLNEVFGEENFVATVVWEKSYAPRNNSPTFSVSHEFVLCYAKHADYAQILRLAPTEDQLARYTNRDNDPRGVWKPGDLTVSLTSGQRGRTYQRTGKGANLYEVTSPSGKKFVPPPGRCWVYNAEKFSALNKDKRIWWGEKGESVPSLKRFLAEIQGGQVCQTIWSYSEVGHSQEASKEIKDLFSDVESAVFPTPKPVRLIERMLKLISHAEDDDIILDFFAGSCTTAHAVLQLNHVQNRNLRFIMVQLPEPTNFNSFLSIAEIGKERIRRVIRQLRGDGTQPTLLEGRDSPEDLGFKVYKLGRSNFRAWQNYVGEDVEAVSTLFDQAVSPLVEDWRSEDVLTEVMLQEGFPLDSTVTRQTDLAVNAALVVTSGTCAHRLFVCLDSQIADATISQLRMDADDIFVCFDSALTDEAKMRLGDAHHVHVI